MVRFCDSINPLNAAKETIFQFQYGAILWCRYIRLCIRVCSISIPVWCDFVEIRKLASEGKISLFQFQYGAILWRTLRPNWLNQFRISIPVWCDFVQMIDIFSLPGTVFQFQYGAILWRLRDFFNLESIEFQFQYGAILCKITISWYWK